jgi:hypothetical protein
MATARMSTLRAERWGKEMAVAARQWAAILAPNTKAPDEPPTVLMLVFDRERELQGWYALWPLSNHELSLRIVKWRTTKVAKAIIDNNCEPMAQLERYIETQRPTNRYHLVYNRKLKKYQDFKD